MAIIGFILLLILGGLAVVAGGFGLLLCRAFGGMRMDNDFLVSVTVFTVGAAILYFTITNAPFEIVLT